MTPTTFPESNHHIGKPRDLEDSQCGGIDAYVGNLQAGNLDGCPVFVTAWRPTPEELAALNAGAPIFLTWCCNVLAPHTVSTNFKQATSLG